MTTMRSDRLAAGDSATSLLSTQHSLLSTPLAVACHGVTKEFVSGDSRTVALRGIDLELPPGEMTLLVGPSGCGKTTLISIVAGLLEPTRGEVVVLGTNLTKMPARRKVD